LTAAAAKLVFLGTPAFAVPTLEALARSDLFSIAAVITQADRPSGRGQKMQPPAVKVSAEQLGIPIFQPISIKSIKGVETDSGYQLTGEKSSAPLAEFLTSIAPVDACVCVAYGKIIPASLLTFARKGIVNLHPSLLPRWRGAAPLQRALFAGDAETGVSIMDIDEGLDSGPVYRIDRTPIDENETLGTLHDRLAALGAHALVECLPDIISGKLHPTKQADEGITYAEKWEREECTVDWTESADSILRRIRACNPTPGARTRFNDTLVKLFSAHRTEDQNFLPATPGTIVESNQRELIVACGNSQYIAIDELQFAGKSRLPTRVALRGKTLNVGQQFA
jgi:methionyl-tRNA formyltransferase